MTSQLQDIQKDFHTIFANCKETTVYTPIEYSKSSDIQALVVINNIIEIVSKCKQTPDPMHNFLLKSLETIIDIKCKEYCNKPKTDIQIFGTNTITNTFGGTGGTHLGGSGVFGSNNVRSQFGSSGGTNTFGSGGTGGSSSVIDHQPIKASFFSYILSIIQ